MKDFQVGVKGIVCVHDQCLMLQNGVYWDVPGGRIDDNETLHETLTRELREELPSVKGFSIKEVLGAYRIHKDIVDGRGLVLIFYKVEADTFEVTLSNEHSTYRWVSKETLPELRNSPIPINPELYEFVEKVLG